MRMYHGGRNGRVALNLKRGHRVDIAAAMTEKVLPAGPPPQHTWAEMREFAEKGFPEGTHETYAGVGDSAETEIIVMPTGRRLVRKTYRAESKSHKEHLSSLVGEAIGAPVPKVVFIPQHQAEGPDPSDLANWEEGDPELDDEHEVRAHILMDYIDGDMAEQRYNIWEASHSDAAYKTDSGIRLGLLDALIGNQDRHSQNWIVAEDDSIWGIDHGEVFAVVSQEDLDNMDPDAEVKPSSANWDGFLQYFVDNPRGPESSRYWQDSNPLHPEDVVLLRKRLEKLESAFGDAELQHEYTLMMRRLQAIGARAGGERRLVS
jgi:hypothetical protein